MEIYEAKILIRNLLKRIQKSGNNSHILSGELTDDEIFALKISFDVLNGLDVLPESVSTGAATIPPDSTIVDTSCLDLSPASVDCRICLDFGTAMSKATLVLDETNGREYEEIHVLKLGIPGDQEEISETMLVSSVFIDSAGKLWFGNAAVQRSLIEALDGSRQRLDNIKRYLSEEGLDDVVGPQFNPTDIQIVYADMVLAYLMFLSWAVNQALQSENQPRNVGRRFAMPCFDLIKSRHTEQKLSILLGEAQLLADTFSDVCTKGIPLELFIDAVNKLRREKRQYPFLLSGITEPLGVAGSLISWREKVNSLVMVIDVGAGTSDFSLYRIHFDPTTKKSTALEVYGSSRGITEAGNYLDVILKGLVMKKAGIDSSHSLWMNIFGALELNLRNYKEALFRDGTVAVSLFNGDVVEVNIDEFISLPQVIKFGDSLKKCMIEILEGVDQSFIKGAPHGALGVALTGGGADLPMVKALARGTLNILGTEIKLAQTSKFPRWLANDYPELEDDYPRISVSLGGARKRVIDRTGTTRVTAGDVKGAAQLSGFYTKG